MEAALTASFWCESPTFLENPNMLEKSEGERGEGLPGNPKACKTEPACGNGVWREFLDEGNF